MKRLLILFLLLTTVTLAWSKGYKFKDILYQEDDEGFTVVRYVGNEDEIYIPKTLDGKPVVRIGKRAFARTNVCDVTISSTVYEIEDEAFADCEYLEYVTFYSDEFTLGKNVFLNCEELEIYTMTGYSFDDE